MHIFKAVNILIFVNLCTYRALKKKELLKSIHFKKSFNFETYYDENTIFNSGKIAYQMMVLHTKNIEKSELKLFGHSFIIYGGNKRCSNVVQNSFKGITR